MRRFFIALPIAGMLWYGAGLALDIDKADAGKARLVWVKCKATKPPVYKGSNIRCNFPGLWVRVPLKWAVNVGIYPILLDHARSNRVCVGGKPKVAQTVGASSWRLVGQLCMKQRLL